VGLLLFMLISPLIIVAITFHLLAGLLIHLAVWCCWCARGRNVLFVYSDSPIWHDYVEAHILPRLGERAVVLNWSHRGRWRRTLAVLAFRYVGGHRTFNPLALVFRPFRRARHFRFYEPFREFKHGKAQAVTEMERELFDLLDRISGAQSS
jgi:hypothetical protein